MRWRLLAVLAVACGALAACGGGGHGAGGPGPGGTAPAKTGGPARWGTVAGTVRDAAGRPVRGALVVPAALDGSVAVPEMAVLSGADGGYEWRLLPGRYAVSARSGERRSTPVTVSVTAGQRAAADLTLAR